MVRLRTLAAVLFAAAPLAAQWDIRYPDMPARTYEEALARYKTCLARSAFTWHFEAREVLGNARTAEALALLCADYKTVKEDAEYIRYLIADCCAREGLWLHIDGAYGAAAVLHPRGAAALEGLGRADSITLDPHKWLFQPFEIGCLLVRDAQLMQDAFRVEDEDHADYLADITRHIQQDVNFFERGIQLTRSFKALKLWLSLRTFGLAAFRDAIQVGFDVADFAQQWLEASGRWEIVTPSQLGIVTFRWRGAGLDDAAVDALTGRVVDRLRADGYATVMSTLLRGRPALRLCPIHWDATTREMAMTLERLTQFALEDSARA